MMRKQVNLKHGLTIVVTLWGLCLVGNAIASSGSSGSAEQSEERIPILGWNGIPVEKVTVEKYLEARDAGFTHLTQWVASPEQAMHVLGIAEKAGIKLSIMSGGNLDVNPESFARVMRNSPALAYYHIKDEPHIRDAAQLAEVVRRLAAVDPVHPSYINMFGIVRRERFWTGCDTHLEYLNRFYEQVPLKLVSFDVYPVMIEPKTPPADCRLKFGQAVGLYDLWYETLEQTSRFARSRGIPMMAFALGMSMMPDPPNYYPVVTTGHVKLQLYSNLAYGARVLQYYTYYPYSDVKTNKTGVTLMKWDLKRSPVYERIREANLEIQRRAFVFRGSTVKGVWHTGKDVPRGTTRLEEKDIPPFVRKLKTSAGGAVVSWLENGESDYLVIINRDPNEELTLVAQFDANVEYVRKDGSKVPATAYDSVFWPGVGDAEIFCCPKDKTRR